MITNPKATRIVLYGDSYVWGKKPGPNERYASDVRFSGVLQRSLGDEYEIIEEGLRARNLVGENPYFADRDGLSTFRPILLSQLPVDIVVLSLGTNDCNKKPDFDVVRIAHSLDDYVAALHEMTTFLQCDMPKLIALLPPRLDESVFNDMMRNIFEGAADKLDVLREALAQKCASAGLMAIDLNEVVTVSSGDGIHLDPDANAVVAQTLADVIKSLKK